MSVARHDDKLKCVGHSLSDSIDDVCSEAESLDGLRQQRHQIFASDIPQHAIVGVDDGIREIAFSGL